MPELVNAPLRILHREQVRRSYYVQTGSMRENPWGVPKAEIDAMEASLPVETVAQAIYGMYVENSGLVFHSRQLTNMFYGEEVNGKDRWVHPKLFEEFVCPIDDPYRGDRAQRKFVAAADLARTNDYTVITVFDCTNSPKKPAPLVWYYRLNRVSWETIYAEIAKVGVLFGCPVVLDSTGMGGDVVLEELEGRFYCGKCHATVPLSATDGAYICPVCSTVGRRYVVEGYNFSGKRKENIITELQQALAYGERTADEWGLLRMPRIDQVVKELTFYRKDDSKLETDTVMSLALVAHQLDFDRGDAAIGSIHGG